MGDVRIDPVALRRLLNSPSGPMAGHLLRAGNAVRNASLPLVPVDEGRLRSDIHVELQADRQGNLSAWIGSRLRYAAAVHNGSRPHFPPVAALAGWVRRHGLPSQAAWAVARRIASEGTEGRPYLSAALRQVFPNAITRG